MENSVLKNVKNVDVDFSEIIYDYCLVVVVIGFLYKKTINIMKFINISKIKWRKNKIKKIENIWEETYLKNIKKKELNDKSLIIVYVFIFSAFFHFFAISENHGILFALFKKIERIVQYKIKDKYVFDDGIIKNIFLILRDLNFYDSS